MKRRTFGESLDEAMKLDAEWRVDRHAKEVICRMLAVVAGKPARLAKSEGASTVVRVNRSPQAARSAVGQGVGSRKATKAPERPRRDGVDPAHKAVAAVADVAHKMPKPDDAKVRAAAVAGMSPERLAEVIDAAVVQGKISGTDAVALLKQLGVRR